MPNSARDGAGAGGVEAVVLAGQRQAGGDRVQVEAQLDRRRPARRDGQRHRQARLGGQTACRRCDMRQDRRLLARDAVQVLEELQVLLADAGDHGDVRADDGRQFRDLARVIGADLGHQKVVLRARASSVSGTPR
jgi:hypothetical protein